MGAFHLSAGSLFCRRFEIYGPVGQGGMGTIYRARDRYTGDVVALKLMHRDPSEPIGSERFEREAQLLAALRHPGIVGYVAHGRSLDGEPFLAMEWLEGEDLSQYLLRKPLSLGQSLSLLVRTAEALAVAHRQGIVHRDIKPANLFLVDGNIERVKVVDFGIARTARSQTVTRRGAIIGTPEYMAPEQARGDAELTPAADYFSLGCVLYECLTGQPPFVAEHTAGVLMRILHEQPVPITQRRPGVPESVARLVDQLLTKEPAKRLSVATALKHQIATLGELPSPATATTATNSQPPVSDFSQEELSLLCVVVAALPDDDRSRSTDLQATGSLVESERHELFRALYRMGTPADSLANGAIVVTAAAAGSATDQAIQAARSALLIKERWPAAVVSMATGRGLLRGRAVIGEVVDCAARAIKDRGHASLAQDASAVLLDDLSARLLGSRFVQMTSPDGILLLSEEREADASRPLLGLPTPCVGRDAELNNLEGQLASSVEEGEARVVLVSAGPGVGKSRLRHELLRRVDARFQSVTLLLGRGKLGSAAAPYGLLVDAIHRLCGVSGGEPIAQQRRRFQSRIGAHINDPDRTRVVSFLGELCHIPFPAEGNPMLQAARQEPMIMQEAMRRALLDWLVAECTAAPVAVVLDDLQWSDELTMSVLDDALRTLRDMPLFVLGFARPEFRERFPRLWSSHKVQELPLKGLSKRASERLALRVLGKEADPKAVAWAVERSCGNALYLEELLRAVSEGNWHASPETVVAMLQARIGKLKIESRRAVRAAAVYGQTFWHGGLAAILGGPDVTPDLECALTDLIEAELVQPHPQSRLPNQKELIFRHAVVRDAAYSLLSAADLKTGHHLAAQFLEEAGEHDAAVIAAHFELSGDKLRAASRYQQAAEACITRGSLLGGLHLVQRSLACEPDGELLGMLRSTESYVSTLLDRPESVGEAARVAIERLRPGSLGWCRALGPGIVSALNRQDVAGGLALASLLLATEPDASACVVYSEALVLVLAIFAVGAPASVLQTVVQRLERIGAQAEPNNPTIRRYACMGRAVTAIYRTPGPWTLITEAERAIALANQAGDSMHALRVRGMNLEWGWIDLGDVAGARQRLSALSSIMEQCDDMGLVIPWRYVLSRALCLAEDEELWTQAEQLVAPMLTHAGRHSALLILLQGVLARVAMLRGRLQEAEAQARAIMQFLPALPILASHSAPVQIRALLGMGRHGEAVETAEQVLGIIPMAGGLGVTEVELRLAASEAFRAAGDLRRAEAELRETLRQVQLRAQDITDPSWRDSYLTRNPYVVRTHLLAQDWGILGSER